MTRSGSRLELYVAALVLVGFVAFASLGETVGRIRNSSSSTASTSSSKTVFDGIKARAFLPHPFPCLSPNPKHKMRSDGTEPGPPSGFFHLKTKKTGSSTAVGVHLRIAHKMALNQTAHARYADAQEFPMCRMRHRHAEASVLKLNKRRKRNSFVWTTLRDPTKRAISSFFYFKVSRTHIPPTDEEFLKYVRDDLKVSMHYFHYLDSQQRRPNSGLLEELSKNTTLQTKIAKRIMKEYDFIAITERMDESIVALQLLLDLPTRHVLRLADSKRAGAFDGGISSLGCMYITPVNVSPRMNEYFASDPEWRQRIRVSESLHRAANKSLDMTIDQLGRKRFKNALAEYMRAQKAVSETCETHELIPCSFSSGIQPRESICVDRDLGCGFECLDKVADQLGLPP